MGKMDIHPRCKKGEQSKKGACACYVLITCSEPNLEGKMEVQMDYEGDATLAAFLVQNAAQVFDDRFEFKESK